MSSENLEERNKDGKERREESFLSAEVHLCFPMCVELLSVMKIKNALIHHIFIAFIENICFFTTD